MPIASVAVAARKMEFARIMDAKFLSYEEKFRELYPDARVEEEYVSENLTRFHVCVGRFHCSESGVRELAFKYAFDDIKEGKLKIPPRVEQLNLWPTLKH
jgi:hypothetical protein